MERGQRLDRAWNAVAVRLPPERRPWAQELAFGVVRMRGRLDFLLDLHLRKGLESLEPRVRTLLRMGAYQLLSMGAVPAYAAVSETVDQVRAAGGDGLARMANGVLRALGREGGGVERFPAIEADPTGHLSTWGSHPRWLLERWLARWGFEETARLVEWNNRIPALHLRVFEPLERAADTLRSAGIGCEPGPPGSRTLRLAAGTDPTEALNRVPAVVQDPAGGWVIAWAGNVEGRTAADLCAAPGGKAMGLWGEGARVVALDPSLPRLLLVRDAARRLGASVPVVAARGEAPPLRPREVVLVDAPCTGTGTLARHPDARWRLNPDDVPRMAGVQDAILEGAAKVVAPGGLLLYATCSLEPEENERRVEAFVRRHPGFILEGSEATGVVLPEAAIDPPFLRVLPQRTGTDGAFAARLRRGD